MTREETKKCIEVMQGYVDGKKIEVMFVEEGEWSLLAEGFEIDFDLFYPGRCRIKEEPRLWDWRGKNIQ